MRLKYLDMVRKKSEYHNQIMWLWKLKWLLNKFIQYKMSIAWIYTYGGMYICCDRKWIKRDGIEIYMQSKLIERSVYCLSLYWYQNAPLRHQNDPFIFSIECFMNSIFFYFAFAFPLCPGVSFILIDQINYSLQQCS
jgi:hypothetical protein